ncbi:N-acetyllactosaminide 3-alpha-galactosyltransferase [Dictyocaulus viviparus]|uniref:N-acetyllactosaminide 3-alpha-galactosyltransferase n=1 Tax=Dictyocaulus viviparus TaxID=29172 RepID=A0A0D8XN24_DICVI|nr:N-acetyllactosaminide 3-alpha-galactosyltransferase [Dictyocaulus viviparus]
MKCVWICSRIWKRILVSLAFAYALLFIYFSSLDESLNGGEKYIFFPIAVSHKLCVIELDYIVKIVVPFRDRDEELSVFVPHIAKFLREQSVDYNILLMNQTDEFRFNRASLINVGWFEADRVGCDYMVMHDVDLLPLNPQINYRYPGEGVVRHISSPSYHPKYNYSKFIGGILMLTMNDYKILNGMSNKYWGWGLEDDEFYLRIKDAGLNLTRIENLSTNRSNTFRHLHDTNRKRDYAVVTKEQKAMKKRRDYVSGLNNVIYSIAARHTRFFDEVTVHVVDVYLFCDLNWTPYCKIPS